MFIKLTPAVVKRTERGALRKQEFFERAFHHNSFIFVSLELYREVFEKSGVERQGCSCPRGF